MKSEWKAFLIQAGAVLGDDHVLHFADPLRELWITTQSDILCDLSHQDLIAVQGEDSQAFLQGQLTNDVRQVTPEHSQLSAYCNPKGRLLACFRLFQRGASYYLCMPREIVESTLKRLRLFVLRSKVSLKNASDDLVRIGLAGPNCEMLLQKILGAVPVEVDQVSQVQEITVIRVPGIQPRFEIHAELDAAQSLWATLSRQVSPVGAEAWRLLDIFAGIPAIYTETSEAFLPQMINLHLINGVSFRKGCYTGQEIIARTQYLGKLKRRMYRAHVEAAIPPRPGEELYSSQSETGSSVGQIVDACRHPEGGYEVLAVVFAEYAENSTVSLSASRAPLAFRPLPYSFTTAGNS